MGVVCERLRAVVDNHVLRRGRALASARVLARAHCRLGQTKRSTLVFRPGATVGGTDAALLERFARFLGLELLHVLEVRRARRNLLFVLYVCCFVVSLCIGDGGDGVMLFFFFFIASGTLTSLTRSLTESVLSCGARSTFSVCASARLSAIHLGISEKRRIAYV